MKIGSLLAALALSTLAAPLVAAESGPEHPDLDHDNDDSVATAVITSTPSSTQAVVTTPSGASVSASASNNGDSSRSSSSGASSTFSQSINIPTENVLAALALGNGGFGFSPFNSGFGFGSLGTGIDSIANVQRSATTNAFANQNVVLNPNDALVLAALGGNNFGFRSSFSPFLGNSLFGNSLFGTSPFGTSSLFDRSPFFGTTLSPFGLTADQQIQCLQLRSVLDARGFNTVTTAVC